ncbi:CAF17-like 4Fe-4S cluster assembly/insertion protein YgfZ [Dongia deserti]|uniref:CAF17-like 4Fe-4S cluster assembly/insertion protein YgfZ n=1 Tax=Dongia deserti TaxID=2268030 RepID=UPI000E656A24|nr:folate-binding protein YgfZ [Dongia deserti]
MTGVRYHLPPDRAVIAVAGEDRQAFLQGLISNDTAKVSAGRAIYATLLTAQGRFLFDLFIAEQDGRYLVDCAGPRRAELTKRLSIYRLRSKATIADADAEWCVALLFGEGAAATVGLDGASGSAGAFGGGVAFVDPRLPELGVRLLLPRATAQATLDGLKATNDADGAAYHRLRIGLGVPDATQDLTPEKSILLENGFDELNAIDWDKGCFMGQELTARTRYRGLVRKRLLPVRIEGTPPAPGTPLMLDNQELAEMRSASADGTVGLAMVRLEALAKDPSPTFRAGDAKLSPDIPGWMRLPELDEAKA